MRWILIFSCVQHTVLGDYYSSTHHLSDRMGWSDKMRMLNVTKEVIIEAQLKIRQLNEIREDHSFYLAFDIGLIMGNIRERYRRMLEFYREYRDKHSERSVFFPSGIGYDFPPIHYISVMEHVHAIEVDIDKLIHVLEALDDEELNPDPRYVRRSTTRRRYMRDGDLKIIARMAEEQELKSRVREEHLMKRLGVEGLRHTSGKRFQQQWPVDKNWELGAYGDMGLYGH